jgi:hypothetical protein
VPARAFQIDRRNAKGARRRYRISIHRKPRRGAKIQTNQSHARIVCLWAACAQLVDGLWVGVDKTKLNLLTAQ